MRCRSYGADRCFVWVSYKDVAPTELVIENAYDRRKSRSILANAPFVIWYLLSLIFLLVFASLLTWRNWQTRTAQDRMGQPVEVRVLS